MQYKLHLEGERAWKYFLINHPKKYFITFPMDKHYNKTLTATAESKKSKVNYNQKLNP